MSMTTTRVRRAPWPTSEAPTGPDDDPRAPHESYNRVVLPRVLPAVENYIGVVIHTSYPHCGELHRCNPPQDQQTGQASARENSEARATWSAVGSTPV